MQRKKRLIVLLFLLTTSITILLFTSCEGKKGQREPPCRKLDSSNFPDKVVIEINPMIELDFKSKKEVYDIRKRYVNQHPELLKALGFKVNSSPFWNSEGINEYQPSEEVFGQITDGKTWWGILGICYYGKGEKSIEGPSEETRFIANPYLLVGLCENCAKIINDATLPPKAIYPEPENLTWNLKEILISVKYNLTKYFREGRIYHYPRLDEFTLVAYNAKDLGFRYVYIDPSKTNNVTFQESHEALLIPQFIHTGGSSGYPGGSNNMSPNFPPLIIKVTNLPAELGLKLWFDKPIDIHKEPDLWYIIYMN